MGKGIFALLAVTLIWSGASVCQALTPEQVIELKRAGVEDQTIRMMMVQEERAKKRPEGMGVREIKDRDGNAVILYSTGEGNSDAARAEEARKVEKAWEMLRHLRIDSR
jgi:hypothetical protein